MIEVIVQMVPHTTTAQQKRLGRGLDGKPQFFKSSKAEKALAPLHHALREARPTRPVPGPVALDVEVTWPWRSEDLSTKAKRAKAEAGGRIWKATKPDLDNWVKDLQDALVTWGFIVSDQEVAELTARKFHGSEPGIRIRIRTLFAPSLSGFQGADPCPFAMEAPGG